MSGGQRGAGSTCNAVHSVPEKWARFSGGGGRENTYEREKVSVETMSDRTDRCWVVLGGMGICVLWEGSLPEEYRPRRLEDALEDSHGRQSSPVLNHRCPGRGNMSP